MRESQLRMQLAQLGLDATRASLPCGKLSGGEQLKAALATMIHTDVPASFLLLDEPSNHLDIPSLHALESFLNQYQGTLIVVSHDEVFVSQIEPTHWLVAGKKCWEFASNHSAAVPFVSARQYMAVGNGADEFLAGVVCGGSRVRLVSSGV